MSNDFVTKSNLWDIAGRLYYIEKTIDGYDLFCKVCNAKIIVYEGLLEEYYLLKAIELFGLAHGRINFLLIHHNCKKQCND
jgi:hypothetical protein